MQQGGFGYILPEPNVILGRGRHCVVKLATCTRYAKPRKVAIKIAKLSPFTDKEAELLYKLNHESIIEIADYFVFGDSSYIVLALAEKGDLRNFVRRRGRLKDALARKISSQLFDGLTYIHDTAAVAHCDLKCENVLIDATDDVKIADFGLAVDLAEYSFVEDSTSPSQTPELLTRSCTDDNEPGRELNMSPAAEGALMTLLGGSPAYAAPEVLDGCATDPRAADVWSAGVIAFFLLTAYLPFGCHGNESIREAMKVDFRWPRPLRQIKKACRTFVESALVLDPTIRPRARELLCKLRTIDVSNQGKCVC